MDCTLFVSDLHCILDDHAKTVLFGTKCSALHRLPSTIQNPRYHASAGGIKQDHLYIDFLLYTKNCTNAVLFKTMFILVTQHPIQVSGDGMTSEQSSKRCRFPPYGYSAVYWDQYLPCNIIGSVVHSIEMLTWTILEHSTIPYPYD